MPQRAVLLANHLYQSTFAKTAYGLVRGPSRFALAAVVDPASAGRDTGELIDGQHRGVPCVATLGEALAGPADGATVAIVGIVSPGGAFPEALKGDLMEAARRGMTLVSGLHVLLEEIPGLKETAEANGATLLDLRRPKPTSALRFWTGRIRSLETPRLAILGMDCAVGKRTTGMLLMQALRERGTRAEMIYTGQTGWLQGLEHGFVFDATLNDFVSGELEHAILECAEAASPDVILLEGQSALRNPSGPAGSEFIVSAGASVVLQVVPGRTFYKNWDAVGARIPPLEEELALVRLLGGEVWALTVAEHGLTPEQAYEAAARLEAETGLPTVRPFAEDGLTRLAEVVQARLA
jgi:uncharacterized NAD-dependent epimerase/dehydratase family protein